ncbi:hypothetical protein RJ639_010046 [Escallonia herrerae]|uniref:Uncharacterized protein n=1 Tax=Escallonia herrerae TaxID=1293975 RepID=A0AA89AR80_9ASTE|nr:hypothetical protein RJ639_010046 [Escallonia herrerae]
MNLTQSQKDSVKRNGFHSPLSKTYPIKYEMSKLLQATQKHGRSNSYPAKRIQLCIRWHNHLDPAIKRDAWSEDEESMLTYYHHVYGNKWADIARFLPGRYTAKNFQF